MRGNLILANHVGRTGASEYPVEYQTYVSIWCQSDFLMSSSHISQGKQHRETTGN